MLGPDREAPPGGQMPLFSYPASQLCDKLLINQQIQVLSVLRRNTLDWERGEGIGVSLPGPTPGNCLSPMSPAPLLPSAAQPSS